MKGKRVDPKVLVELLLAAFTAADFRRLFLYSGDQQLYRFMTDFSDSDGLAAMVDKVMRVARQNPEIMEKIIAKVRIANVRQYNRFESLLYI